ncbi:tRNA pseudouridine synthase D [Catenovulum agarivorans DS-2]|uniref:tRNA pseudouridine synthase D n=1 Tax=Catenovulum agarivorans DS-2 TaxID=1328313 RepID=W7QKS1_9ALTE|nr:tRNA pseudouridine(13) synthase TruD [Catenovulum agarivorans]EWH08668.1 tRNA pseudouridine synthase D [Catenovulum agarivorans DS-2]
MKLAYLHGIPQAKGSIRNNNADFFVEEVMHFDLDGQGEHLWLWIEKDGQNTQYVAKQLAKIFGIAARLVSTSGMKDRHAITRQWFCLPWPIKKDIPVIQVPGAKVLEQRRHGKKLKIGTHKTNRFKIRVRLSDYVEDELETRLQKIKALGVANYFGEQRFGKYGDNVEQACKMFSGEINVRDRKLKGLYLSAARSELFNQILNHRIEHNLFKPINGDAFVLNGSHSYFVESQIQPQTLDRFAQGDILLSGAMFGDGEPIVQGEAADIENNVLSQYPQLTDGLIAENLKQDRRALQLPIEQLSWTFEQQDTDAYLSLNFLLPAGCFATSVLREIVQYEDESKKNANTTEQR